VSRPTVGILGGGQLARMLALAARPLEVDCRILDPQPELPAASVATTVAAAYDDPAALERFADGLAVVTYEFENVPVASAERLARRLPVLPPPAALAVAQDRLEEKTFFTRLGIATPAFAAVGSRAELDAAVARIGLPAVLKTRRLGYDGKGQVVVRAAADTARAWAAMDDAACILEAFVAFDRELSILGVRSRTGEECFYPVVENHHRDGILRLSIAPAPRLDPALQAAAEDVARRILDAVGYAGVLAVELFQAGDRLLANEMAPRVHNSGHWTIEGAETSQFENHVRAVLGWPLGSTAARGAAAMVNAIGTPPDAAAVLAVPGAHLHLYGKTPRPGRKVGHVTVRADDPAALTPALARVRPLVDRP
jgi:5-(carboxyamino)imidazole ribonucleotide synthase